MKAISTVAALAALFVSPSILAEDMTHTIYGKANVGVLSTDTSTAGSSSRDTNLKSFASRLGVKGKAKLTDDLSAIYQLETEVDLIDGIADEKKDNVLKARNSFVGLEGNFGKVIAGISDTPMKQAEGKIDLYSDIFDIARVQDPYMDTQEREHNFLGYYSPKFNNMHFNIATTHGKHGSQLGDAYSTSLVYGDKKLKKSKVFAALAYDKGIDESQDSKAIRLSAATKVGRAKLGAIIERADSGWAGAESQTRYVVSSKVKLKGKNHLSLQYASSNDALQKTGKKIYGSNDLTLGISHNFTKHTSIYGALNRLTNVNGEENVDANSVLVGMVHKFKF